MKEMGTVLHAVAVLFGCLVLTGILMLIPVLTTCAFFLGWKFSGTLLMLSVIEFFGVMSGLLKLIFPTI